MLADVPITAAWLVSVVRAAFIYEQTIWVGEQFAVHSLELFRVKRCRISAERRMNDFLEVVIYRVDGDFTGVITVFGRNIVLLHEKNYAGCNQDNYGSYQLKSGKSCLFFHNHHYTPTGFITT